MRPALWDDFLKDNPEAKIWLLEGGYEKLLGVQPVFEYKAPVNEASVTTQK